MAIVGGRAAVVALAIGAVIASTAFGGAFTGSTATASAAAASPAPTPVVSGNQLLDSRTGDVFVPHGANWPSFEYACTAKSGRGWGFSQGDDSQAAADAMKSWHINTIRIPLNQDCWLGDNPSHLYGSAADYRAAVRAWVDILNGDGIVAILDLHWNAPTGKIAGDQYAMPDPQSTMFWNSVAAAYKSDPSVIFDAFNEPYSRWNNAAGSWAFQLTWDCWEDGGCAVPDVDQDTPLDGHTYTAVGMSALVAAIRAAGATQPVMLGGIDYSNDLTGWLAHKPDDSQLIASWHNYPGQRCDTATCWNAEIAPVAASVPVVAGEFGETDGGSGFLTTFMDWADSHGIGYLPWAWWEVDASENVDNSRYALVTGADFTPKAPAGTAFHDHLLALAGTTTALPLLNPGFESGTSSWAPHSNRITLAKGGHPERAHTGTGYLNAVASTAGRGFEQVLTTPVAAGDTDTAVIWLRTQSAKSERIQLVLAASGGEAGTEEKKSTVTITTSWRAYSLSLPVSSAHANLRFSIYLGSANRVVFADDAALSVTR